MGKTMNRKKFIRPAILLGLIIVAELLVWNLKSVGSLFSKPADLPEPTIEGLVLLEDGRYQVPEGTFSVTYENLNQVISNLSLGVEPVEDYILSYVVEIADEGNYYPYELPTQQIVQGVEATGYTNLYAYGKLHSLKITYTAYETATVQYAGARANVHIPWQISPLRMCLEFVILLLLYMMWTKHSLSEKVLEQTSKKQRIITIAVILLLVGFFWILARMNPVCVNPIWPHHKQYQELAEILSKGQVYLDEVPPQELVEASNPYDTIWLQAHKIPYKADYAYYNGHYYVYFGIVPELLLYLPCYLVTGHHLPNYAAVGIFFSVFVVMIFALYREIAKRWFPKTSYLMYLLMSSMTVLCGSYICMLSRPDLYDVPIAAANMFTAAGLWCWFQATGRKNGEKGKIFLLVAGSLCMALVAGCRPQMLLFSALALPIFWNAVFKDRTLFSGKSVKESAAFVLPYVLVAVGVMYYNAVRFGSVFDFGATYSLTSNDMTRRNMNLAQLGLGLYHFFLQLPVVNAVFPLIQRNLIENEYMGKLTVEYTYGGLLASNAFLWVLLGIGSVKKKLKEKKAWCFLLTSLCVGIVIAAADISCAGILQRYMTDFTFGIALAATITGFALVEKAKEGQYYGEMLKIACVIICLQLAVSFCVIFGGVGMNNSLEQQNPQAFYSIATWFG